MNLEQKKIEMHIARVKAARLELEYKLGQRLEEIESIKKNIEIQIKEETRLKNESDKRGE